jgi:hypothetical protein
MFAPRGWLSRRIHQNVYRTLEQSELFDRSHYRQHHLRGLARIQDPLWHFVTVGWKRGLSPSTRFDTQYYLMKNDDVRVANLNPLFHFEEYGRAERRLPLRSALEAQHAAVPEASPLRFFITPSLGHIRTSVLFDSASEVSLPEEYADILFSATIASGAKSSSLRILFRPHSLNYSALEDAVMLLPQAVQESLEITEIPLTLTYSDVPFFDEEHSVATSWSSATALRYVTKEGRSWVYQGGKKRRKLESNDAVTRASQIGGALHVPDITTPQYGEFIAKARVVPGPGLTVLVDFASYPVAYFLLIESLAHALLEVNAEVQAPPITFLGNPGERFSFAEEVDVSRINLEDPPPVAGLSQRFFIMSGRDDPLPLRLTGQGFTVVHATPGLEDPVVERTGQSGEVMRVSVSPHSIITALKAVLT